MRILICGLNFAPELTGVGKYTGEMAAWLAKRGHQVRVVTAPPYYPQYRLQLNYSSWRYGRTKEAVSPDSRQTMEVIRCPLWVPGTPRGWQRILHLLSFALTSALAMLPQILWRPDIVLMIEPTLCCSPQALLVARLSGAVAWLHIQDFEVDAAEAFGDIRAPRLWGPIQVVERFLMRRFDRVSTISRRMVERLSAKGVDNGGQVLFPNWVDTSVIFPLAGPSPMRKLLGISEDVVVALYSGNMGRKQGLELLIEASRRLCAHPRMQFVFCGDGSLREDVVRLTKTSPNALFLSLQPRERLNDLLNLADIHLLPQRADVADLVMPSKLTGMFATGRVVLATAAAETQLSTVLEGRGIVTPPGDIDAFVAALIQLADAPALRRRLGAEGRKYATDHMDIEAVMTHFEADLARARHL